MKYVIKYPNCEFWSNYIFHRESFFSTEKLNETTDIVASIQHHSDRSSMVVTLWRSFKSHHLGMIFSWWADHHILFTTEPIVCLSVPGGPKRKHNHCTQHSGVMVCLSSSFVWIVLFLFCSFFRFGHWKSLS